MGREIERKYLVTGDTWRTVPGTRYRQGYLNSAIKRTVRVRTVGDRGYLTIKGITVGASRSEFEYEIPVAEADEMLYELCETPPLEKNRHKIAYRGQLWEVDEFFGENEGLVVAEIELQSEDQIIEKPDWLGEEVTEDPRYFNSNLTLHPYSKW